MSAAALHALNGMFFVAHTGLCLLNLLGWAHPRTRSLQRVSLAATAFSWFAFGIWRGWGYCLCTDWHMQVRDALGFRDESRMYVQLMIESLTGLRLSDGVVVGITGGGFAFGALMSLAVLARERRSRGASDRGKDETG